MSVTGRSGGAVFLTGAFAGLTLAAWFESERKRSRAERGDPEGTEEVFDQLTHLFDELELDGDFETEQDFHDEVVEYLKEEADLELEVCPFTPVGRPDILVGGCVALEVKAGLSTKGERDRCVGQVAGFARAWLTVVVIFDTAPSQVRALRDSLDAAGLDHIPIVDFD